MTVERAAAVAAHAAVAAVSVAAEHAVEAAASAVVERAAAVAGHAAPQACPASLRVVRTGVRSLRKVRKRRPYRLLSRISCG